MFSSGEPKSVSFSARHGSEPDDHLLRIDLQEMIDYGRQQQRSLMQQREQMMNEIRKESGLLLKEFEKKNQELVNTLKSEVLLYLTSHLETM